MYTYFLYISCHIFCIQLPCTAFDIEFLRISALKNNLQFCLGRLSPAVTCRQLLYTPFLRTAAVKTRRTPWPNRMHQSRLRDWQLCVNIILGLYFPKVSLDVYCLFLPCCCPHGMFVVVFLISFRPLMCSTDGHSVTANYFILLLSSNIHPVTSGSSPRRLRRYFSFSRNLWLPLFSS